MTQRSPDPEALKETAKEVFDALAGAMTSAMIHLGDRLGLYRSLAGGEAVTSAELAQRVGLSERWVREWLFQQGASGLLESHEGDRFSLSPEAEAVLADESHPAFGGGFFSGLPQTMAVLDRLPEAFETGRGLPYDAFGPEGARGIERGFAPWFRTMLLPLALPRIEGIVDALKAGIEVADIGCGTGVALLEMAGAFPNSRFHGYDISEHALARAEAQRASAGLGNLHFHHAREEPLPEDGRFSFVTAFDCLHDMTDPDGITRSVRRAIADDGLWLVCDIKAHSSYRENAERNPMASLMYGMSVMTCMSSALSEEGGAGLGTLGLHADRLEAMVRGAGFSRFEAIDFGHPVNAFYLVRP